MSLTEDAVDVRLAQAGDRDAYARLVGRYTRRVYDLARRMLRDPHEAEDVVQHAFWNAWRALDRFDPERPFRNWLLRIASNLCRNRLASRGRRPELRPRGGEASAPEREAPPPTPPGAPALPLREAIEALPAKYRLPILLHYLQGLALDEIAEITGVGVPTVKTHLHRGRARLRALLDRDETQDPDRGTTP